MALHRLLSVTLGVPDVAAASGFYRDFGLVEARAGVFATAIGGEQLRLEPAPHRRLRELAVAVDDTDDLDRVAAHLAALDVAAARDGTSLRTRDRGSGVDVRLAVAPRLAVVPEPRLPENGPGRVERAGRSPALDRRSCSTAPAGPRRRRDAGPRGEPRVLRARPRVPGERRDRRPRLVSPLLDRSSQPAHPARARDVPPSHRLGGGRRRRDRPWCPAGAGARIRRDTPGASAAITWARTSSGTCATPPATSPSTTATSTSFPTMRPGRRRPGKDRRVSMPGDLRHRRSFLVPDDLGELIASAG